MGLGGLDQNTIFDDKVGGCSEGTKSYDVINEQPLLQVKYDIYQADGTWTDIPRCVEHEPGVEYQVPGKMCRARARC